MPRHRQPPALPPEVAAHVRAQLLAYDWDTKEKDRQERLKNRSINLQRLLHTNIDRCLKKSEKLDAMLAKCKTKEDYKIKGDLLTSFIYSINPNDSEITLHNFYSEDYEDITINLDPNKSPAENVQSYYKKYNKLKKSEEDLEWEQSAQDLVDHIV